MRSALKCIHLSGMSKPVCLAGDGPYLPSMFELREYCLTKDHSKCPFFLELVECLVSA